MAAAAKARKVFFILYSSGFPLNLKRFYVFLLFLLSAKLNISVSFFSVLFLLHHKKREFNQLKPFLLKLNIRTIKITYGFF